MVGAQGYPDTLSKGNVYRELYRVVAVAVAEMEGWSITLQEQLCLVNAKSRHEI